MHQGVPDPRLRVTLGITAVALAAMALALLVPGPVRRWLAPGPVPGLEARLSADGRLLGHFPYPEVPASSLVQVAPGQQLQRDAAEAVLAMQRAAAAEGVDLVVLSAFRPIALQKEVFFDVKSERNQSALERSQVSAPPGFSEHSTGYAVDFGDGGRPQTHLSGTFAATPAFRWLKANGPRFHFILSFPPTTPRGSATSPGTGASREVRKRCRCSSPPSDWRADDRRDPGAALSRWPLGGP